MVKLTLAQERFHPWKSSYKCEKYKTKRAVV